MNLNDVGLHSIGYFLQAWKFNPFSLLIDGGAIIGNK
jgi:hypothetical protein